MGAIEEGKNRVRDLVVGLMTRMSVDPTVVVLKWDPPEEIRNEYQLKLPDKSLRLRVYRGQASVAINVLQSDVAALTFDAETQDRYKRQLLNALVNLCGEKMCQDA